MTIDHKKLLADFLKSNPGKQVTPAVGSPEWKARAESTKKAHEDRKEADRKRAEAATAAHKANGGSDSDYSNSDRGYGKRRYMGDDVESESPVVESAALTPKELFWRLQRKRAHAAQELTGGEFTAESNIEEGNMNTDLEEGDVNYAKMHTQANPKYATGTKWRKSSAAVKAKPDDVGAGELGAHGGGSGHVSVKATMNQRDKLADRQEINARGHKAFAIKQTRTPRSNTRRPLPEGLTPAASTFVELVESQLNEISRNLASSYISGAKHDERKDRSAGVKLAQKKKWGDAKFGFEEPKVKATSEEVVSESSLGHYHSVAEEAIDNATGFAPSHHEYHKWMAVHHKAMRAHYEQQGNRRLADSHDAAGEHHAAHVDDEDFHNGESHHWNGF